MIPFSRIFLTAALCLAVASQVSAAPKADPEAEYYRIVNLPTPELAGKPVTMEAGAVLMLGADKVVCSSRLGDIWIGEGIMGEAPKPKWTRFASGLHEVLGLAQRPGEKDGWLYCTQRGEITRMRDRDGDGRADDFETVGDGWGINGDYHEYAFGSKFDREGNMWVVLCLTGSFTSDSIYRGWCLRVTPEGKIIPTASGVRSPGGIGISPAGDVFYTDNQGPWNGACKLQWIVPGKFLGNPTGNKWFEQAETKAAIVAAGVPKPKEPKSGSRVAVEAKAIPELLPPTIYFPYRKMGQSAAGMVWDTSDGKFGPFAGQLFVGDQTDSTVMRVFLEKVNGLYQGACFPFRKGFDSGTLSMEYAANGSMLVYGTDRGWGARGGKPYALQRLDWTGKVPFEILEMKATVDGFELVFTQPVDAASASNVGSYKFENYTFIYQSSYGSPEVDSGKPVVRQATVSADGLRVRLTMEGLQPGHVHELHATGVKNLQGAALLHEAAYYTLFERPAK